jgi:hypothetical protein
MGIYIFLYVFEYLKLKRYKYFFMSLVMAKMEVYTFKSTVEYIRRPPL